MEFHSTNNIFLPSLDLSLLYDEIPKSSLKAARFAPLPGIGNEAKPSYLLSPLVKVPESLTPSTGRISTGRFSPRYDVLAPIRNKPLRIMREDKVQMLNDSIPPPLDFVTENISETRPLTKRWRESLLKLTNKGEVPKQVETWPNGVPSADHKRIVKAPTGSKEKKVIKGPRIQPIHQSRIQSTYFNAGDAENDAPSGIPRLTQKKGKSKSTSRFKKIIRPDDEDGKCSVELPDIYDRFLQDDNENLPSSPRPMKQIPNTYRSGGTLTSRSFGIGQTNTSMGRVNSIQHSGRRGEAIGVYEQNTQNSKSQARQISILTNRNGQPKHMRIKS